MNNSLALYNAKGGTGKTTVAINLAGALNTLGQSVLLIDLDPQGNATEALGMPEVYNETSPSLPDYLTGETSDGIVDDLVRTHSEMDLIPASVEMLQLEQKLAVMKSNGTSPATHMKSLLKVVEPRYNFVLLDCPPFFGSLSDSALVSAGNVVIPSLAESTSQRAVELLLDQMARLHREYEVRLNEVAAVANRIEHTNEAKKMVEWFHQVFDDIPVFAVRKRVAFQRSYSEGISLFEYDPSCDMCLPFKNLARSVMDKLGETAS